MNGKKCKFYVERSSFGVQAIPFTAVIDQQGKVLSKGLRGAELSQFINENLK